MSDRIKKIKIKQADGTYSDYIPIGANAKDIDLQYNGSNVENTLKKKPYYYDNVATMKLDDTLKDGDTCITLGYYEINDGGNGVYKIIDDSSLEDDGGSIHELNNGLKAQLIIEDKVNIKQFGAYGDGEHDDTIAIQTTLNKFKYVFIPNGIYNITQITINQYQFLQGSGENSIIYSTLNNIF